MVKGDNILDILVVYRDVVLFGVPGGHLLDTYYIYCTSRSSILVYF